MEISKKTEKVLTALDVLKIVIGIIMSFGMFLFVPFPLWIMFFTGVPQF